MEKAAITGYSIVKPSRARKDKNEDVFTNEQYQAIALNSLLKNIGMTKKELDSTRYALVLNRPMWPHALIWTSEVISNLGLSPKLTYASDHGGASALFSMIQAQIALNSGFVDHAIIIGSDSSMTPFTSPNSFRPDRTWRYELNYEMPLGMIGPLSEAALIMRKHMETYGTTAEQLGIVAVAQRKNACQNPNAYLQKPLTMDEYLNSPMIAEPVRMLDAVIPINAAYAMMMSSPAAASKLTDKPVFMEGFETSLNYAATDELRDITDMGMHGSMEKLLEMGKISRKDIDFLQLYDDFTVIALMQFESMGFAEKGKGGKFVENNDISFAGSLPVNTGGGQLSGGQAGTAGGYSLFVEAVQQLRGEAGGRQVKGASRGIVSGLGGLGYNGNLINKGLVLLSNQ